MTESQPAPTSSLLQSLAPLATGAVAVCLTMRPFCAGQLPIEPETAFLQALVWFAVLAWSMSRLAANELRISIPLIAGPLFAFVVCLALSIWRGWTDGNGQAALDMGRMWFSDIALCLLLADMGRDATRRRLFVCCLLAGVATVALYAVYQRLYAMAYFREVMEYFQDGIARTAGQDERHQSSFSARLSSTRVTGPFGYANALAGFHLLLLPILLGIWRNIQKRATGRSLLAVCITMVFLSLCYSGSKAGFLVAKAIEVLFCYLALQPEQRSWRMFLSRLANVLYLSAGSLLAAGALALLASKVIPGSFAFVLYTVFAICWSAEWMWLASAPERRLPGARIAGGAIAALIVGIAFWVVYAGPVGKTGNLTHSERLRDSIWTTLHVRGGYWQAAVHMTEAYPLRGVGLDNFASHYTQYKSMDAWPVRRAHNHYLQLAADGGLPLLLSFCLIWILFFREKQVHTPPCLGHIKAETENGTAIHTYGRYAVLLGPGVLFFLYFMRLRGAFGGLSVEFVLTEYFGTPETGSIHARTGNNLPLLIHACLHFLLLPGIWGLAFHAIWKHLRESDTPIPFARWTTLGIGALLLHATADFHLMNGAISQLFWAIVGLSLASCIQTERILRFGARTADLMRVGVLLLTAGAFYLLGWQPMQEAWAVSKTESLRDALMSTTRKPPTADEWNVAWGALDNALSLRPRDPDLYRYRANLRGRQINDLMHIHLRQYRNPDSRFRAQTRLLTNKPDGLDKLCKQLIDDWDMQLQMNPYYADGYAKAAQARIFFYPDSIPRLREAEGLWRKAISLNRWQPRYRLGLAQLLAREPTVAARKESIHHLNEALDLDTKINELRSRLTSAEREDAKRLLQRLRLLD